MTLNEIEDQVATIQALPEGQARADAITRLIASVSSTPDGEQLLQTAIRNHAEATGNMQ